VIASAIAANASVAVAAATASKILRIDVSPSLGT
jgi:hypothetical protein